MPSATPRLTPALNKPNKQSRKQLNLEACITRVVAQSYITWLAHMMALLDTSSVIGYVSPENGHSNYLEVKYVPSMLLVIKKSGKLIQAIHTIHILCTC